MKFALEPYRRNVPDEAFLEDMRKVAGSLGRKTVTMEEYAKHGIYHSSSIARRFGSWFTALERAGLEKARSEINIPLEKLVSDLKRVSQELGKKTITHKEYSKHGQYSPSTLISHFGSWKSALEQNDLKRSRTYRVSEEEYFENLEYIWRALGRQPRYSDMQKPLSKYSAKAYEQKFGTWRKALEAFVEFVNKDAVISNPNENNQPQAITDSGILANSYLHKKHKTSRAISWRLRFLVMRRDNFKCCISGHSPATHPGTILEVDHIIPWDSGGETVMDNLQTLCQQCNGGKSNLTMHEEKG
jgi:5-methylcytosine-specific restriction endonuclease McrA